MAYPRNQETLSMNICRSWAEHMGLAVFCLGIRVYPVLRVVMAIWRIYFWKHFYTYSSWKNEVAWWKNGLLRDLVILYNMLQEKLLTTFVYSDLFRVLWCAEIAAVLTFWAFRGEINSCKGLTMTMAMRQPLIEHNSSLFEVLAFFTIMFEATT